MPDQSKVFQEGSGLSRMDTPPNSPELLANQILMLEHIQQFTHFLKIAVKNSESPPSPLGQPIDTSDGEVNRASKLEFKAIDEV